MNIYEIKIDIISLNADVLFILLHIEIFIHNKNIKVVENE